MSKSFLGESSIHSIAITLYQDNFMRNLYLSFAAIFFLALELAGQQPPCECTNCPVTITDNGTFYGYLDVSVSGPNDLGQCPLQQVCFQITHTWVGDLSVTLISPSGLNYLVMADLDNGFGGCGNQSDNIDVCIDVGTGNPLTNNTEYVCNGGNPCLVGNWTAPCGGVTDPVSGAVQAPNCDLDDFNVPGDPANGTWTLVINDICAQDVGTLDTWNLVFACGTNSCVTCEADGGMLNQPDVSGCMPDPGLNLNITPTYPTGTPAPPASDYSYTFVYSLNGIIMGFVDGPNLNGLPSGTYQVCGLSYFTTDAGLYNVYIGQPYNNLVNDLANANAGFCGDLSSDCFNATINPFIPPTVIDTAMCIGDCFTNPLGFQCCSPGPCQYTLTASTGCDSLVIVNIAPILPDNVQVTETVCPNECLNIDGVDYCPPGTYVLQLINQQGCDSIVQLTVLPVPVVAGIAPPPQITCDMPAVLLDGTGSTGNTFEWQDSNGQTLGTLPTQVANQAGTYSLIVGNTLNGVTCYDTAQVTVTENLILPNQPVLSGPLTVCQGSSSSYNITNPEPNVNYTWTVPTGASITSGGNGSPNISIQWDGPVGGDICVTATNSCGSSTPGCITVAVETLPQAPAVPTGPVSVCTNSSENYSISPVTGATSYTWSVPAGATITSGQGTTAITVAWGNSSGGQVCVHASNNCGNSPDVCIDVSTTPVPFAPSLSGPLSVCEEDTVVYNLIPDPNATGYTWTIPPCANLISGQGTSSITVSWPVGCSGGAVCATADNACGSSAQSCLNISVEPLATQPVLSGPTSVCQGDLSSYSLQAVNGAVSYNWSVSGGSIQSGQGSTGIDVLWDTPGSGQVCASAVTACGEGMQACLNISIDSIPALSPITGNDIICAGSVETYTVPALPNASTYTWSSSCGNISSGQGSNSIQIDWTGCNSGGQVCVTADVPCGTTAQVCLNVNGGTLPATPVMSGPSTGCYGAVDTFCVNTDPNVSSYTWSLNGLAGTILSGQGTECISVSWNGSNQTGDVCVVASNGCGDSPQACMPVEVPDNVVPIVTGPDTLCQNDTATYLNPTGLPADTWSVDCGTIISSSDTALVVVWDAGITNCQVCLSVQECYGPADFCLPVELLSPPMPDAGPDMAVCGLIVQLQALGSGQWSQVSGPGNAVFVDPASPTTEVSVDAYGSYTFSWTADNGYCTGSDEVSITFNDDPAVVSAVTETCTADALFYFVSFDIGDGQPPYNVTGSVGGTLSGNTFTSDLIPGGTAYNFDITDANGCGPVNVSGIFICNCITDAGSMPADTLSLCVDEQAQVQMPADTTLDGNDIALFVLHEDNGTNGFTLGNIISINNSGAFDFLPAQMSANQVYYISVIVGDDDGSGQVDMNDLCLSVSNGQLVIWHAYPTPDAGPDDQICGLDIQLQAQASIGSGQWTLSNGPGNAIFADPTDPASLVSVDTYGSYTFIWTEDNSGCTAQDEVLVSFNDDPVADVPVASCDVLNLNYTVSFNISGGTPPYMVSGTVSGSLSANTFTSDPIPQGTAYSFDITDVNGCGPVTVSGMHDCPCTTDAGSMGPNLAEACVGETITLNLAVGTQLDPEDILLYVLQDQASGLGNVFAVSDQPQFALQPGMAPDTIYYVAAMAGNDLDNDGQIDTDDPCISVSAGQPLVWHALPQLSLAADATVCEGDTALIPINIVANGCVDLNIQLSDGSVMFFPCLSDGDFIGIPTAQDDLSVSVVDLTDENGCQNTSASTAQITVNTIPQATVTASASVCNSTDSGSLPTTLDFDQLITGGDATGSWENTDGAVVSGNFPLLNFDGAAAGQYTFTYTTGSALPPCENVSYTVEVSVEDCACPSLELAAAPDLCNGGDVLDLAGLSANAAPGSWSLTAVPPGSNPAQLSGNLLLASGADVGTYELTYMLSQAPPTGCPTQNSISLNISQALSAGVSTGPLEFCFGESQTVSLFSLLQGADAGGSWEEISSVPSTGNAFDALNGTFETTGQQANDYTFRYVVTPDSPCPEDMVEVMISINPLPAAAAGADQILTCFEPEATLGESAPQLGPVSYNWTSDNGILPQPPDAQFPQVDVAGTYTLTVTSLLTGCQASDEVVIEDVQDTPVPYISLVPISCYGYDDGALIVDSIAGGTPPFLVSFNGGPFANQLVFNQLSPDVYTIVVQDVNGCESEPLTIDMEQPQELNVAIYAFLDGENVIVLGDSLELAAQVNVPMEDIDSIAWMPPDILDCDTCFATWAHPLETTTFSVMVESNGCTDEDYLTIGVRKDRPIYVPNAFSPNGDGKNDVLFINAGPQVAKIKSFLIFNRWGETVFQYYNFPPNDPAFGWDGRYRGQDMNPGVFVWYAEIEFVDGSQELYKGDVILVR